MQELKAFLLDVASLAACSVFHGVSKRQAFVRIFLVTYFFDLE